MRQARLKFSGKNLLNSKPQPELTKGWKEAVERGIASDLCDRIVKEREIPDRLIDALCAAFRSDETIYTHAAADLQVKQRYKERHGLTPGGRKERKRAA